MQIRELSLKNLLLITPAVNHDTRGYLIEAYRQDLLKKYGVPTSIVQINQTRSLPGVIRGLHFQWDPPLGKYIRVVEGKALCVALDIRIDSPSHGKWIQYTLSNENNEALYVPVGFAFGFSVIDQPTAVEYLYTAHYNRSGESTIYWNDPDLNIPWGISNPLLSPRDAHAQSFHEWIVSPQASKFSL